MPPIAPRNLTATVLSYSSVRLDWIDCTTDELGFDLLMSTNKGGLVTTQSISPNVVTLTLTDLAGGTTYFAQLRVRTPEGEAYSEIISFTTSPAPSAPSAPSGLVFSNPTNRGGTLAWTQAGTVLGSQIETIEWAASTTALRDVGPGVRGWNYTGLKQATLYRVRVRSSNAVGWSDWSTELFFGTLADPNQPPIGPANLVLVADGENGFVASWDDRSVNESGFRVHWKITGTTNWQGQQDVPQNTTTLSVSGLTPDTSYTVRVYAFSALGGLSAEYVEGTVRTEAPRVTIPSAPTALVLTQDGTTQVLMDWTDNSHNEQNFVIYRRQGVAAFAEIATTPAGVATYRDTAVTTGETYDYHVTARNSAGESAPTDDEQIVLATQLEANVPPDNLVAIQVTNDSVLLGWNDNAASELTYDIFQADSELGVYAKVGEVGPNITTFLLTGLAPDEYWFRVDGVDSTGTFGSTNLIGITLSGSAPAAPTAPELTVTAVGARTIKATTRITDFTTTNLQVRYRTTAGPGAWADIYNGPPTVDVHHQGSLQPNTSYDVQAIASNVTGSGSSAILAVTTLRETGGSGLSPWRGKRQSFAFDFDKDDLDRTVLEATTPTVIESFNSVAPDQTIGPFCELLVDGINISPINPVTGVAWVRGWLVQPGSTIALRFTGTGTALGTAQGSMIGL